METVFEPVPALIGGGLIGLAAVLLMATLGRIAGISGIAGRLFDTGPGDRGWRLAFIAGLLVAPWLWMAAGGNRPVIMADTSPAVLVIAGLLVGYGTRMGGGCTSGHGICGLARLSARSAAAVLMFVAAAMLTVFVRRHLLGEG
jgi:uncharacterized membrane protein YedE/YeeE